MTLSPELIKVYASGGVDDIYVETLSLIHPLFTKTWNIVNNTDSIEATTETGEVVNFEAYPFFATLSGTGETGNQDIELAISNVDRRPIDEIERASENPTQQIQLIYRVYILDDLSQPGNVIDGLSIADVAVVEDQIIARASPSDLLNRVFPSRVYTSQLFPGLFNV